MRIVYSLSLAFAAVFSVTANANAITEFCPARLTLQPSGGSVGASRLYAFELTAQGPRSVTAILAFDTDAGWFTATVPPVAIAEKDRHYSSSSAKFTLRDWVSSVMYLQFPKAITVRHAWVKTAQASGDDFGWAAKGAVECAPSSSPAFALLPSVIGYHDMPAAQDVHSLESPPFAPVLDPKDKDDLTGEPPAGAKPIIAAASKPLEQAQCMTPFREATLKVAYVPDFPLSVNTLSSDLTSTIEVVINPDASIADAWVLFPGGLPAFDETARRAALKSSYGNAIAYCQPVPSLYLYKVTFSPNG